MTRKLTFELPADSFADEYQAFVRESIEHDGGYPWNNAELALEDFPAYVQELNEEAQGIGLPEGVPPQTTYFLILNGDKVIGEFRYRPTINEPYEEMNGHFGANLRPAYRGMGLGTQALAMALDIAQEDNLDGVFLPIDADNYASQGVVKKYGGKHIKTIDNGDKIDTFCYWIDLK